jgi:hypothetical protein
MKSKRNLIQICLLCAAMLPAVVQAQFIFTTNNDGSLNISQYTGSVGAVAIPSMTNGLLITSIGTNAFINTDLTSVTIPYSITNIGNFAFVCELLTAITVDTNNPTYSSVDGILFNKSQTTLIQYPSSKAGNTYTIPSCVTSIGGDAFYFCLSLTNITIGNSTTNIGDMAFYYCGNLTSIIFGNSVICIGSDAFEECYSLTSITIPNSVISIGDEAFYECNSLTNVTVGDGVTNIGNMVFVLNGLTAITVDTNNPTYSSVDGILFNKSQTTLIQYPRIKGGNTYTIPSSVTSIGSWAFS